MSGSLLTIARSEARGYLSSGGFEELIDLKTPDGAIAVQINGWATKHHLNFDTDGTVINSKNAHICLSETELVELGYPVRVNEEVSLKDHLVTVKDSSGLEKNYVIRENYPNETLGLIACILGDYNGS